MKILSTVITLILVVVVVKFAYSNKKSAPTANLSVDAESEVPGSWDPMPLVEELYHTMDGFNFFVTEEEQAWLKLAQLASDDMVRLVYNNYNAKYGDGESLTQVILSESGATINSNKPLVIQRLQQLNLA